MFEFLPLLGATSGIASGLFAGKKQDDLQQKLHQAQLLTYLKNESRQRDYDVAMEPLLRSARFEAGTPGEGEQEKYKDWYLREKIVQNPLLWGTLASAVATSASHSRRKHRFAHKVQGSAEDQNILGPALLAAAQSIGGRRTDMLMPYSQMIGQKLQLGAAAAPPNAPLDPMMMMLAGGLPGLGSALGSLGSMYR